MDYEKKYKEALEIARKINSGEGVAAPPDWTICEVIFPELKESEDKNIKQWLIGHFQQYKKDGMEKYANGLKVDDILAWLEKQGDKPFDYENANIRQKDFAPKSAMEAIKEEKVDNANKVEPKFKVGNWVINRTDATIMQIVNNEDFYESVEIRGQRRTDTYNYVEWDFRLWSIRDAKPGDILCTYECDEPKIVFILKGMPKKGYALSYHCYYNIMYPHFESGSEKGCLAPNDENVKPATKEQCDLLFQKMKEAGYEWDAEKKELKKIEQNPVECSEEDERMRQYVVNDLKLVKELADDPNYAVSVERVEKEIDWIESLKERIGG